MFNKKTGQIIVILTGITVILTSVLLYTKLSKPFCQVFAEQAQSFIHGRLYINTKVDSVYYNGNYFWPQGPFPSVLLIPFQLIFGPSFTQISLQPFLVIALAIILYKLARLKNFNRTGSLKLVFAFLFSSLVFGIIIEPCYSFFAHTIAMVLLALILLELEGKQRFLVLGLIAGLILATRPTAGFIIPVIIYYILRLKGSASSKFRRSILFLLPILISVVMLLWFNNVRFNNPFESGYSSNLVGSYLNSLRNKGVFNMSYIPRNLIHYFLKPVQLTRDSSANLIFPYLTYNPIGLSFFIVSPFFLYSLKSLWKKDKLIKLYWVTVLTTIIILLSYYASGWVQYGPRFTSDFMPVLYLLTLYGLKGPNLSQKQTLLILISSLINAYLLLTGFFIFKT